MSRYPLPRKPLISTVYPHGAMQGFGHSRWPFLQPLRERNFTIRGSRGIVGRLKRHDLGLRASTAVASGIVSRVAGGSGKDAAG